ncbi:hypothetical protein AVL50_01730 [Flammeovirga sp. SJP92]|nr:hypothetical protein AVL50_01730 [Flammeovirga sp. SJP92]
MTIVFFAGTGSHGQTRKNTYRKYEKQKRVKTTKRVKKNNAVYYRYSSLPRRGALVTQIPHNAIVYNHHQSRYYYSSGIWYRPNGRNWIVARPANGIRIKTLPVGHQRIRVRNKSYYYYYGTYYQKRKNDYVVVDGPVDAEVNSIPKGYNEVIVNGEKFYELDGDYYMNTTNDKGEEVLVLIPEPSYKS